MKVRRYYIGFGPKIFSFRRGETEYGLKALPLGGFCDIAGMTALDEMTPEEEPHAMYKKAAWKRVVVMSGGIAMNFILGFLLIYALLLGWGRTEPAQPVVQEVTCVAPDQLGQDGNFELTECSGGPRGRCGPAIGRSDHRSRRKVDEHLPEVAAAIRGVDGPIVLSVDRDGEALSITVVPERVQRYVNSASGVPVKQEVSAVGIGGPGSALVEYNALTAVPAASTTPARSWSTR